MAARTKAATARDCDVRDPSDLPAATRERVEVVKGSHADPDVVIPAVAGADAVFWLTPPDSRADSVHSAYVNFVRPACRALTEQGVQRVVGVSALGRDTPWAHQAGNVTASLTVDDLFAATGVSYRALVMPSFMDNTARQTAMIRDKGMVTSVIAGDRAMPFVATVTSAKAAGLDDAVARTGDNSTPTTFRQWCQDVLEPAVRG